MGVMGLWVSMQMYRCLYVQWESGGLWLSLNQKIVSLHYFFKLISSYSFTL